VSEKYRNSNIVHALAIYDWASSIDILACRDLFERFTAFVGAPPDDVWVCAADTWKGKDYKYRNFVARNIIAQQNWQSLSYQWRRQSDARLYFAIRFSVGLEDLHRKLSVLIDEAAVSDVDLVYEAIVDAACTMLQPIYGIGFATPYSWSPSQFVAGQGSGYTWPEENLHYNSPEAFCLRGLHAGRVLRGKSKVLDKKLRDIFDINLVSAGHLNSVIEGLPLEEWIKQNGHGTLRKITPIAWRWDVPRELQPKVRKSAIAAGLIADPFWTKLGWIDD
jgi:hypothetical protein